MMNHFVRSRMEIYCHQHDDLHSPVEQHLWLPFEQVPCADPSPAVLELELAVQPLHVPIVPPLAVVPH